MRQRNKNLKILKEANVYNEKMEHDACGVGLVASTEGKKNSASRRIWYSSSQSRLAQRCCRCRWENWRWCGNSH